MSGLHSVAQSIAPEDAVHAPLGESGDCERGIGEAGRPFDQGAVHHVQARVALHSTIEVAGLAQDGAAERVRGHGRVERQSKRSGALSAGRGRREFRSSKFRRMIMSEMQPEVNSMNSTSSEQIAPEIVQAIIDRKSVV